MTSHDLSLKEEYGDLRSAITGQKAGSIIKGMEKAGESITDFRNDILQTDPGFDPSGVPDFGLRSGLSRADTVKERKAFLDKWAGPKGWTQDRFGAYALTPAGMTRLGHPHKGKPVLIDEPWSLTRYDIADITGEAPAIAGATAAGLATGGAGFLTGIAATAAGAGIGKAIGEGAEELRGENLQTFPQVAGDVGEEALYGALGEGAFRSVLKPIGKKILSPRTRHMTPERTALSQQAEAMGTRPNVTQIAPSPLLARYQSLAKMIFGNPLAKGNAQAITKEMNRLRTATGGKMGPKDLGDIPGLSIEGPTPSGTLAEGVNVGPRSARTPAAEASLQRIAARQGELGKGARRELGERLTEDISRYRRALARWSSGVTKQIDEMVQGEPIVPLKGLKGRAEEILETLPRDAEGNITMASKEMVAALEDIQKLPDFYTTGEMQQVTSQLFNAIGDETIVPGITGRNARLLWRASTDTYDDIVEPTARKMVQDFRGRYRREITRFDNALIERIIKSPKLAGRLEPEEIVGAVFAKGKSSKIGRLKAVVTPQTWNEVKRSAMEEVLGKLSKRGDDPFEAMFQGKQFLEALDSYGSDTLDTMFGKSLARDLYRLGRVTQLVTQEAKMTGGLVAASLALHPLKNLGRLTRLFIGGEILNTPFAIRWLTEGLKAPNTRRGAAAITRLTVFIKALAEQHTRDETEPEEKSRPGGVSSDKS